MPFRLVTLASASAALALSTALAVAAPGAAGHSHRSFAAGERVATSSLADLYDGAQVTIEAAATK